MPEIDTTYIKGIEKLFAGLAFKMLLAEGMIAEEHASSMKDRPAFSRRRRQLWAVLLKIVWDIDALKCPKCGGQMEVISVIEQQFVIRRILKHLDFRDHPGTTSFWHAGFRQESEVHWDEWAAL